jgi:AcrR family transcriptional regulator
MTEQTRHRLLETGRKIFAVQGLAGARVDLIAEESGVNKALINYHFRGKRGLYTAVLADLFERVAGDLEEMLLSEKDPARRLEIWPEKLWEVLDRHPDFAPLFVRELADGCNALTGEGLSSTARGLGLMTTTMAEGDLGREIGDPQPFTLHLLLLSTLLVAHISGPLRDKLATILPSDQLAGSGATMVPLLRNLLGQAPGGDTT